eukprot:3838014-Prymnesium_polylepis.1
MRSRPGEIGARSLDLMRNCYNAFPPYASDSLTHKCASKKLCKTLHIAEQALSFAANEVPLLQSAFAPCRRASGSGGHPRIASSAAAASCAG